MCASGITQRPAVQMGQFVILWRAYHCRDWQVEPDRRPPNMTLTELKYIVAVAREKHVGRAAEAC